MSPYDDNWLANLADVHDHDWSYPIWMGGFGINLKTMEPISFHRVSIHCWSCGLRVVVSQSGVPKIDA